MIPKQIHDLHTKNRYTIYSIGNYKNSRYQSIREFEVTCNSSTHIILCTFED